MQDSNLNIANQYFCKKDLRIAAKKTPEKFPEQNKMIIRQVIFMPATRSF
jgi:hypothetical protein